MKGLGTLSTVIVIVVLLLGVGWATAQDLPAAPIIQLADESDQPMPPPEGEEPPPQDERPQEPEQPQQEEPSPEIAAPPSEQQ